jgi:NADH-quinone oxidoreductase subunit M
VLIAAAFTLRAIQLSFFGATDATTPKPAAAATTPGHFDRITTAERAGALLLIAATVYIGLKPDVLLQWILPRCSRLSCKAS